VRDARTQFWYPRLTRHPDTKILAQTNTVLEQRHWGMSLEALAVWARSTRTLARRQAHWGLQ
jgi:hypothetical protein